MVSLEVIRASNAGLKNLKPGLVAVFGISPMSNLLILANIVASVGGTSGIGEGTLQALVRHTVSPRVYIVGR